MNITDQIESVFNNVKEAAHTSDWARGFDDYISKGEKSNNTNDQYNNGFKYAKELRGK